MVHGSVSLTDDDETAEPTTERIYASAPPSGSETVCGVGSAMQTIAVGHCHHNFIFCNEDLQTQVGLVINSAVSRLAQNSAILIY